MAVSHLVTSLLVPGTDPQPLVAEVIGAEASATTYVLNCVSGTDGNDCGTYNETITLGPWASKTLAPGADATGDFDLYVNTPDEYDPWKFSVHCQMSRSIAQGCTTVNIGGNNNGSPTATLASTALKEYGFATFDYMSVTITAGQEFLSASPTLSSKSSSIVGKSGDATASVSNDAISSVSETAEQVTITGSAASSAASPEKTSSALSNSARIFTAMLLLSLSTSLILL
ncbi:hypothetical protein G7046_g2397 [Stylonectria norvegica]|nr:hypothetical protein G7046_g2397 [Stylonectria norvegica]